MRRQPVKPGTSFLNAVSLLALVRWRTLDAFMFSNPMASRSISQDHMCWWNKHSTGHICPALSTRSPFPSGTRVPTNIMLRLAAAGFRRKSRTPGTTNVGRGPLIKQYADYDSRGSAVDDGSSDPRIEASGCENQALHQKRGAAGDWGDGGFGWLREFGNGNMDIAGLVLSTVLLMTSAAPLGVAADLAVADGPQLDRSSFTQPTIVTLKAENAPKPAESTAKRAEASNGASKIAPQPKRNNRVGALKLTGDASRSSRVAPIFSGIGSNAGSVGQVKTQILGQEPEKTASSVRKVTDWARAMTSRTQEYGSAPTIDDETEFQVSTRLPVGSDSRNSEEESSVLSSGEGLTSFSAVETTSANHIRSGGLNHGPEELKSELLEELEHKQTELFGESLPLPATPESFNVALRKSLPALIPPAMAVFLTVSMPAVILLLKGIGTTLVAVVKGYGKGDRTRSGSADGTGASLEVGLRDVGGFGGGGPHQKRRGRSQESPGSAFQMFLAAGDRDVVDASVGSTCGREPEGVGRLQTDERPAGSAAPSSPLPTQHVETERQGFFNRQRRQRPQATGRGSTCAADGAGDGGFAVGDDAMAAMAMAAMTQELNLMKQSLQTEVETMKKELQLASEDSQRLTDKLFRLEEDNRQLEAMVSRLGGHDARRLKAQLFSLLASPSMGQHGIGSSSPQLTPA